MAVDKRSSTGDPLTEHDVADRIDKAAIRLLRILLDVRQNTDLYPSVRSSRYHTNVLDLLANEIEVWLQPVSEPAPTYAPTVNLLPGDPCKHCGSIETGLMDATGRQHLVCLRCGRLLD